jgi:glycosyltransferase involved in cell wall biosynthesis
MPASQSLRQRVIVITNLYPVSWAPNRASFNKQQFDRLAQHMDVNIFIFVPWIEWRKQRKGLLQREQYIPYFYLPKVGRWLTPFFQLISLLLAYRTITKFKPDSVIASWAFPDAVAVAIFCKLFNLPFVVKAHGTDVNENLHRPIRQWLMRKSLNYADKIFCASQALAKKFEAAGLDAKRLETNYNGVDKEVFFPAERTTTSEPIKILFVGSIIETKGVNELYHAFKTVKDECNCSLDYVGEGYERSKLEKWAQQDKLSSKIKFSGSLSLMQVAEKIRHADILVLPSYREGVPNVLLEAFASGTPVVATKVGGIPEVVSEDTGVLVDAQDAQSLAEGIKKAVHQEWEHDKILEHAQRFNWDTNITRLMSAITK